MWFTLGKHMLAVLSHPLLLHMPRNVFQKDSLHDFPRARTKSVQTAFLWLSFLSPFEDEWTICLSSGTEDLLWSPWPSKHDGLGMIQASSLTSKMDGARTRQPIFLDPKGVRQTWWYSVLPRAILFQKQQERGHSFLQVNSSTDHLTKLIHVFALHFLFCHRNKFFHSE